MLHLRGVKLADALGHAPAFDVIRIVGDFCAGVVPIGVTADRRRDEHRGRHQAVEKAAAAAAGGGAGPRAHRTSSPAAWRPP